MTVESRTRVTFFLPVNGYPEARAASAVTRYLRRQKDKNIGVTGFTHSALTDPVFHGEWWSPDSKIWMRDRVVLFIIDYCVLPEDPELSRVLAKLRRVVAERYAAVGSAQEDIWLIAERSVRYA